MAEVSRPSILSICDHQGTVLRLESESGLVGSAGQPFVSLLDGDSVAKGRRFLELLQRENVACDWTLNLRLAGRICSLTFCGIRKDAELIIVGGTSLLDGLRLYRSYAERANHPMDPLFCCIIERAPPALFGANEEDLDEFTRLNNELVDAERELARRNAELKRIAQLNSELRIQAEETLEVHRSFLSLITHDLKNPLSTIIGFVRLIQSAAAGSIDAKSLNDWASRIDRVAVKMVAQIDELLDVAKLQTGDSLALNRKPLDLVATVRAIVAAQEVNAGRCTLRFESSVATLIGTWDLRCLERALTNLIANAIKYSPMGGDIRVRVWPEGEGLQTTGVIRIEDQGLGIPADDLPFVFAPFRRARTAGKISGTGIGLASARYCVEEHKGRIQIESQEGVGTSITIRLPDSVT